MNVTLAKAFIIRARLTKLYSKLRNNLAAHSLCREFENDEATNKLKDETSEMLNLYDQAGHYLADLNAFIDEANAKSPARKYLSLLTHLKMKNLILTRFETEAKQFQPTAKVYDSYAVDSFGNKGAYVEKQFVLGSDLDFKTLSHQNSREITDLEDKVAQVNAETIIDIPQEILEFISNNF